MLEGGPLMLVVLLALGLAIAVYVTNKRVKANREAISRIKQEKTKPLRQTNPQLFLQKKK